MLFYLLCVGAGLLMIAIVVLCVKCRNQGKITHKLAHVNDDTYPQQNTNENERSLQLEDVEHDKKRPSLLGQQAMFENDSEKMQRKSYKQIGAGSVMSGRMDDAGTENNE